MHITEDKLKEIIIESGVVDDDGYVEIVEEAARSGQTIYDVLIGRGVLTEEYWVELLQPYFNVDLIDLRKISLQQSDLELLSESYAKSKNVVLFEVDSHVPLAKVAMVDPFNLEVINFLRAKLGMPVKPYLVTMSGLKYGLKQYKKEITVEFNKVIAENIEQSISMAGGEKNTEKLLDAIPVISILNTIIERALVLGASDIHFEPLEKEILIRYRVDGLMHEIVSLPIIVGPALVARVKVLCNLLIDEHRVPQDGRFRFEMEDVSVDVRVNVMPVFHGEKVEMRLLRSTARSLRLEDLGLSAAGVKTVQEEIAKPHGMILVTGPTGHGKTTTLYSILHLLNTPRVNITTIEDPVEYELKRVNQTQVNTKAGVTFASGLRSLLRQNPDIIMVGEIRDNETVDISIHAALTGHLMLSTLHTNDAPTAVPRLIDMGAQPFLLASTLNLIIAQRLVRRICSSCIISYPITPDVKKLITTQLSYTDNAHLKQVPARLYKGQGCKVCGNTGFHGQVGLFELLQITDSLRPYILNQNEIAQLRREAIKQGMDTLFADGLKKIEQGMTTVEEVLRVVRE